MTDGTNETPTATGESVAIEENKDAIVETAPVTVTPPPVEKPIEKPAEVVKHAGGFFVLSNDIVRRFKKNRELSQGENIMLADGKKTFMVIIGEVEKANDHTIYHYDQQ